MDITARLDQDIKAAGVPITGVSIVDSSNKATWTVDPPELQALAQPVIDAFSLTEPPPRLVPAPGRYLGVFDVDPESSDGDMWVVREAFPTQRRQVKFRDGAVTRTLYMLVL